MNSVKQGLILVVTVLSALLLVQSPADSGTSGQSQPLAQVAARSVKQMKAELATVQARLRQLQKKLVRTPEEQRERLEAQRRQLQAELARLVQAARPEPKPISALQPPPANEACADGIDVTDTDCPFSDIQDTVSATDEGGEPEPSCGSSDDRLSVWYDFTNTSSRTLYVTASTNNPGTDYDTVLTVYRVTGSECNFNGFQEVGCNDDTGRTRRSKVSFIASPGVLYKIQVTGFHGEAGLLDFSLSCAFDRTNRELSAPPSNDDCEEATVITDCPFTDEVNTDLAGEQLGEPLTCLSKMKRSPSKTAAPQQESDCDFICLGKTVWYQFTNTTNASLEVTVSTVGSSFDTVLAVYQVTGTNMCFDNLTLVACDDESGGGGASMLTFTAAPMTMYKIQVGGFCGETCEAGTLEFSLNCPDTTPPMITCPPAVMVQCDGDVPAPAMNLDDFVSQGGSASDDRGTVTVRHVGDMTSGSCPKTITRTYQAVDEAGNMATCTQTITVADTIPPTVTSCPTDATIECPATPEFGTPTFSDNCDTSLSVSFVDGELPATCPAVRQVRRTWTATDDCGNTVQCSQTITVQDTTKPTVTQGSIAACYASVAAAEAAALAATTATDECSGTVTKTASTSGTCSATITVTASDSCGNSASVQYHTRIDSTPPTVTQGSIAACYASVAAAEAAALAATTATDECSGTVTKTASTSGTCSATITVTASDSCGNSASVQYHTRIDSTPPLIRCPAPLTVQCDADVPAPNPSAVRASDNCGAVTVTHVSDVASGACPKIITRTYQATDACGNVSTCTQTITVQDTLAPVITCPPNLTVDAEPNGVGAQVTFSVTARDNCTATPMLSCTPPSGHFFQVGTTTVTCTATDACGNRSQCTFLVTINPPINRSNFATIAFQAQSGGSAKPQQDVRNQGLLLTSFEHNRLRVLLGQGDGTFRQGQLVPLHDGPTAIAVGDFNNDGFTDAAVTNQLSDDVSVVLGNGDGTFRQQRLVPVGSKPSAVVGGDFNRDGRLDLAVANFGDDTVLILVGQGDGTFRPGQRIRVGTGPTSLAVADFNGDGSLDLAVSNFTSNDVTVLHGQGHGHFARQGSISVGDGPLGIAAADFTGDGLVELATVNFTSDDVTILRMGGPVGFQVAARRSVGEGPVAIVAGPFLRPQPGIAVADRVSGQISLRPGDALGQLLELQRYGAVSAPVALTPGDFNNDDRLDLAVLDADGITVRVLLDQGDGTFRLAGGSGGSR